MGKNLPTFHFIFLCFFINVTYHPTLHLPIIVQSDQHSMSGYGPSKALLACYTMLLAKENPSWNISCCSPGFIDTKLTAGWGASKTPEEGTMAIRKLLFEPLEGNGW